MSFLSLYRKYRPRRFYDLVGQEHVVQTLKNALKNERISHAYLFAGPRGTGKTSTAKVFSMALNCRDKDSLEPCGDCKPCKNIKSGKSIDVIEIDAASNRGIDEIRELREKVKFYPGEGLYKVYIIDEVHMLTKGAFNALLKTLEEPPENVVFILATTEPHKVISTILSRCQRFDFSLLSVNDIQQRLAYICKEEDISFEGEALNIIAHGSNGGLRDAIGLLDQAISYTDGRLEVDTVRDMLGKIDKKVLSQFIKFIVDGDSGAAIKLVNELLEEGRDITRFVNDLTEHCRQLLLIKECGRNSGLLDYSPERLDLMATESDMIEVSRLMEIIKKLTEIREKIKYNNQPRVIVEIGIVEMVESISSIDKLDNLEKRLAKIESRIDEENAEIINKSDNKAAKSSNVDKPGPQDRIKNDSNTKEDKFNIDILRKSWPDLLGRIKKEEIKTHAFLIEGKPVKVEEGKVYIQFSQEKDFHKKGAEKNKDLIKRVFSSYFSANIGLEFVLAGESIKDKKKVESDDSTEAQDEMVEKLVDMFDGEVIEVNHNALE